jgi:hypothetical protein
MERTGAFLAWALLVTALSLEFVQLGAAERRRKHRGPRILVLAARVTKRLPDKS